MMAYTNPGFVISVLHQSNPIREVWENNERICRLPFESEYVLRLWNKTSARAMARVEIDGMKASANEFVLQPGEKLDLERFCLDGNLTTGKRFKFTSVEKGAQTGEIQDPTSPDNGKIRVTFFPERSWLETLLFTQSSQPQPGYSWNIQNNHNPFINTSPGLPYSYPSAIGIRDSGSIRGPEIYSCSNNATSAVNSHMAETPKAQSDAGGTATGSTSTQQFSLYGASFPTKDPVVLEIRLKGPSPDSPWTVRMTSQGLTVSYQGHEIVPAPEVERVEFDSSGHLCLRISKFKYLNS